MKLFKTLSVFLLSALAVCAPTYAATFVKPPETNWPDPQVWQTEFPYQRNILWDFAVDPAGGPDPAGPPGVHYQGSDDPELKASDYVELTGDVQWYDTVPDTSRTGLIGIDNRWGSTVATGTIFFHIDNHDDPQLEKHIWLEFEFGVTGDSVLGLPDWSTPGQVDYDSGLLDQIGTDWDDLSGHQFNLWASIAPNPPWEEGYFDIDVDPGAALFFDSIHIATECVPEPATLGLLVMGGLVLLRRKHS